MSRPNVSHRRSLPFSQSGQFLYRSVSQVLRERIAAGIYEPGARVPGVADLAGEFGVSTITIRRAVRDLSLEGLLIGRQGLGLFVASERRIVRTLTADRIAPIEEDVRQAGFAPGLQDINLGLVSADGEASERLFMKPGVLVYRLERILLADGEPVGLDMLWLPRRLGDRLKTELRGHFVMPLLETHGIAIDHIDYQFEAATAAESEAAPLNVMTGFPLLVIRFTPIGPNGSPILAGRTTTRADRFTYKFCGRPIAHHRTATGLR
jgi:DNA-binding GntR family transcriptional regulator